MLTVLSVVGTRPEAIKMAPVVLELGKHPEAIRSIVVSTGQHRQMLDQVLDLFRLRPDVDLNVMQANQSLSSLTAALFTGLDAVIRDCKPDWVLGQGDTTSVLVAGLVSFYHRIKFGHIEAGLRTGDLQRPFPEELNRRVADLIADAYFAPTAGSQDALLKEGVAPYRIHVTGNTVVDALLHVASLPFDPSKCSFSSVLTAPKIVLITAHRRESFGEPFYELCRAIRELALSFDAEGVQFVYPVHLNPRVQEPVKEILSGIRNVHLIEPLDYFNMVHLMRRCSLILTDSGGIQEEAPSFGVPVLVMRDTTERPEGVAAGVVRLVGTQSARIVSQATSILRSQEGWIKRPNPYGDGRAAQRIVSVLLEGAHS